MYDHSPSRLFLVLSRQRSASTTLVRMIDAHPDAVCLMELLNPGGPVLKYLSPSLIITGSKPVDWYSLRAALNVTSHAETMHDLPGVVTRFLQWCPRPVCGFKIFDGHVVPPASLPQLLRRMPGQVKLIVLERQNITQEYDSWRRAVRTGNWGRTPSEQHYRSYQRNSTELVARPRPDLAQSVSFEEFRSRHISWFREVDRLATTAPTLRLTTEEMILSEKHMLKTRTRVFHFLELHDPQDDEKKLQKLQQETDSRNSTMMIDGTGLRISRA